MSTSIQAEAVAAAVPSCHLEVEGAAAAAAVHPACRLVVVVAAAVEAAAAAVAVEEPLFHLQLVAMVLTVALAAEAVR